MRKWAFLLILFAIPLLAQPQDVKQAEIDSLKAELEETKARLDSLVSTNNPIDLGERVTEAYEAGAKHATRVITIVGIIFGIVGLLGGILGIMGLSEAHRASKILDTAKATALDVEECKEAAHNDLKTIRKIRSGIDRIAKEMKQFERDLIAIGKKVARLDFMDDGYFNLLKKNYKAALAAFNQAKDKDPTNPEAWGMKGYSHTELGQLEEALAAYENAIRLHPKYAEAHYNMGWVLDELGDVREAIASYRKAIEFNPEHSEAYYNLACALVKMDKPKEAFESLRESKRIEGDLFDVVYAWQDPDLEALRKGKWRKQFEEIVGPPPEGVEKPKAKRKPKPKSTKPKKK